MRESLTRGSWHIDAMSPNNFPIFTTMLEFIKLIRTKITAFQLLFLTYQIRILSSLLETETLFLLMQF